MGIIRKGVGHQVCGEVPAFAVSRSPFLSILLSGHQMGFCTHVGRQRSFPHIFSRHTFHAYPRLAVRIIGVVSEGDSHLGIRIFLEEVHVQRCDTEVGVVVTLAQHGQVERVVLLGDVDAGIEGDVVRVVAHMGQSADDDVVGVVPVAYHLEVLYRVASEIEGIFSLDGGVILICGQGRVAVIGGVIGFHLEIGGLAVFLH